MILNEKIMRNLKHNAIHSLDSTAEFHLHADGTIDWFNNPKGITEQDIVYEMAAMQNQWDSTEYARLRKAEYDLLNQDELRYDDMVNGTNTWGEAIEAIKAKYPKPV